MKPEVAVAIEEIQAEFPESRVTFREDADGGAFVFVDPVDPGEIYEPRTTWIGFRVTFQYPYADVYPHFVRPDLKRVDGKVHGEGISLLTWEGWSSGQCLQLSRRSNRGVTSAAVKLHKVLAWLRTRS